VGNAGFDDIQLCSQIEVNVTGQLVRVLKTVDAVPGNNIYLSFDQRIQKKAEDLLLGVIGSAVAMDPTTGFILAMASSPSYDPNMFVDGFSYDQWESLVKNPSHPLQNKAIQAEYPPASTYKIITAMAGLEEGVIDEKTTLFCPGGYKFADREYRCWKKGGHGTIAIGRAIAESCDVFFYQVGLRLGVDRLATYAKAAGLGALTGIQLEQESGGLIPTSVWKKRRLGVAWQGGETLSVSIGQGYNLATPLQLATMISSIANGGTRVLPLIVMKIQNASGETIMEYQPQIKGYLPVSTKNLDIIKKGLWEVVNGKSGTARIAHIDGIDVSGKTGTAQVFSRKADSENEARRAQHLKSHAWFVAYAPSENPKIAVSVLVEHGEHGGSAAGPIASELIREYFTEKAK
jgi:penicillin-binding protein 2